MSHVRRSVSVGALVLTNACMLCIHICYRPSNGEETWSCWISLLSFVACFLTLRHASICRKRQSNWNCAVCQNTVRHLLQNFRLGDLSLCDEPYSDRSHVLDVEPLMEAREEDTSHTCIELSESFPISGEWVRLHLHRIWDAFKLSRLIP